jgi:hypothetical protein
MIPEFAVKTFKYGIVDEIEAQSIPDGAASSSLNWQTRGDKIEMRRGYRRFGSDAGAGRVTGLRVLRKQDGTEVMVRTRARKVEYYDETTADFIENGSNVLAAAADGEDISIEPYQGLSGAAAYLSSKNSSIYKIMVANPGSITDLVSTDHRGKIRVKTGRMYLWDLLTSLKGKDETALFRSYIDKDEVSDFTAIAAENVGTGDAATVTFTGTLAFKAAGSKRTCFLVRIYDTGPTVETFYDDKNGLLVGSAGGTGTINYTTGSFSVTFNAAPAAGLNSIKADYYWEDSTSAGLADFSFSGTRTAGQGYVLRQDDGGGAFQNIGFYGDDAFCFHKRKTWRVRESIDDLDITNLVYRELVGIPYFRAQVETGEGIYYVDDSNPAKPRLRLLTLDTYGTQVVPLSISDRKKLESYLFDYAASIVFGDWVLFACRTTDSSVNNRVIVYDRRLKTIDVLDYYVSCFDVYNGALVAGDSMSNNVYELFSGFDDDDAEIPNSWDGNLTRLQMDELKKAKRLRLQGEIGPEQEYDVWLSLDRADFVYIGTVSGDGSYVDRTSEALVGNEVIGKDPVGGGGSGVVAYNYLHELSVRQDKFDEAQIRFVANGIGYVSISMYSFFDIRKMGQRIPTRYR